MNRISQLIPIACIFIIMVLSFAAQYLAVLPQVIAVAAAGLYAGRAACVEVMCYRIITRPSKFSVGFVLDFADRVEHYGRFSFDPHIFTMFVACSLWLFFIGNPIAALLLFLAHVLECLVAHGCSKYYSLLRALPLSAFRP